MITGIESLNLSATSWASLNDFGITRCTRTSPLSERPFGPRTVRRTVVLRSDGESSAKMSSISSRRRRVLSRRTLGRSR